MSGMSESIVFEPITDEQHVEGLRTSIEALAVGVPMYSRNAYTHRRTPHVVFKNGYEVREGDPAPPVDLLAVMCRETLNSVTAYRNSIPGPVDLVWRIEPELRTNPATGTRSLYCRLCFEPSLANVAKGVWVDSRLTEQDICS